MIKDGGEVISIVRLKEEFAGNYLDYLSKQVAQDFNKYVRENVDYEFDELYNIIGRYEEIESIEVVNSFIIDLDKGDEI